MLPKVCVFLSFTILLYLPSNKSYSQHYFTKPYLVLEDSVSQKVFKLNEQVPIFIKTKADTQATTDFIIGYISTSVLITKKHKWLNLSEIEQISFKSPKPKRTVKQILGTTSLIVEGLLIAGSVYVINRGPTPGGGGMSVIISAVIWPLFPYPAIELSGLIAQAFTPLTTLNKNTTRMYIMR